MYHIRLVSLFSLFIPLICCGATLQPDSVVTEKKKVKQDAIYKEKELSDVSVVGKDRTQRLREGAFSVNAVNIGDKANSINDITEIINRTAGVKVRTQGGMGSDFDLSVNGLSGNSIRYFIDGVPLETKGAGMKFSDIPINLIQHIEIYKGVVPSSFGIDALGGAVNIVTKASSPNASTPPPYLDASYSIGAFGTHQLNVNGQYVLPKTKLILRPVIAYNHSKNNYTMKEVEVWDEESRKYLPTERKRFHDGYTSFLAQFEAGFTNMPWADAAFITASFSQMHKELCSNDNQKRTVISLHEYEKENHGLLSLVQSLVQSIDSNESIMFLGRYNSDADFIPRNSVLEWRDGYKVSKVRIAEREIPFRSVHSAKGLEADHIILVNCSQDGGGFPSTVSDDPILGYLLSKPESYSNAEERRLFYVAITRAKKHSYILYNVDCPSPFVNEVARTINHEMNAQNMICPMCNNGHLHVLSEGENQYNRWRLYGCTNRAASCKYTWFVRFNDERNLVHEFHEMVRQAERRINRDAVQAPICPAAPPL